ncbi:helix-turn-helix domain-containing protein [Nocardiopsis dassonvillei]|uniref:helix-turn-helix domain-containing protein n=1 Tax=Nocardiopsis dassonvillei TaxID=2014 RepID=UPI00366DF9D8
MEEQHPEANARFGRELSRRRRASGYTQERLGKQVGVSQGHIGNIERGERSPDLKLVTELDRVLGADGRLERFWGQLSGDGEPVWLDDLDQVERDAVSIMEVQTNLFPSVLQVESYAYAAVRVFSPWMTPDEVESSVRSRLARAQRFASSATVYRAVIDAAVLRRQPNSDAELMAEQLRRVVDLVQDRRISIQLVTTGWHAGLVGTFKLIASSSAPEVVYVESAYSGRLLDDPQAVQRFRVLLSDAQAVALSPQESLHLLQEELARLDHG